jgi:hypothetical protein
VGDPQLAQVALGDAAAVAGVHQAGDAVEQAGPGGGLEGAVAGVGEQELAVAGGGVRPLPLVAAEGRGAEAARAVELLAGGGNLGGGRQPRAAGRGLGVPALVAGLGLVEERQATTCDVVGGDGRQRPAGPQRVGGLGDAHRRVDPVERGRHQDEVERLGRQRPVLEGRGDDLDRGEAGEPAPGDRGEVPAQLHGDDPAAALGQRHGRLPGPGADLQHPAARPDAGQPRQVLEQRRRVARPGPVVQLGGLVEGPAPPLAVGPWHGGSAARTGGAARRHAPGRRARAAWSPHHGLAVAGLA